MGIENKFWLNLYFLFPENVMLRNAWESSRCWHFEAQTKVQMHFIDWKLFNFDLNFSEFCSIGLYWRINNW